ncbi:CRISPR system precrRNA processing endoribonuclease RAMP protein Cas6 [Oxynema sp. CENA135]|nr:CRISPR system precrRNA processing endoribonuclease RAMP protein Cas6 [Oxynema sp. CENA135]
MLIRSHWTVVPCEPAVLPRSYHLELVKELHRRMGLEMGNNEIPTIAYSGLVGFSSRSKEFMTFHPDQLYSLSLSGLCDPASKAIADLDLSEQLEFLGFKFELRDRTDETSSYEELYTTLIGDEPEPVYHFELDFKTPTAFSQNRIHLPLPLPISMFRSWLERWNYFSSVYLGGDDLLAYLNDVVAIGRHNIKTRKFQVYRSFITGFIGNVRLQILRRSDPLLANVAHLLVQYSQFAGTGAKTRLGMGQTQIQLEN